MNRLPTLLLVLCLLRSASAGAAISLDEAIALAQRNDPWMLGSEYRQQSIEARAVAAGTLPDPMLDLGFANLPTDTFDFDQEAMTQFKVGVVQTFPRGDSRALDEQRLNLLGEQFPFQREDRRARLGVEVASVWLDAWRARESIRLIEGDRELFEQLVDVAESSYASAVGRTRQQDLVRAQLELTRLEDRLAVLHEQLETSRAKLGQWLRPGPDGASGGADEWLPGAYGAPTLAEELPDIPLRRAQQLQAGAAGEPAGIASLISGHPALRSLERRIDASRVDIELARQKYWPEWKVAASYGYREDGPMGQDRPDFFSVGLALDLPFFTARRQDRQLQSAIADSEAMRTEKMLALRKMVAGFETLYARLQRLEQRRQLYRERLLPEMHEQAEASLSAYTRDDGDFAEVVRARIAELNARIEALDIDIARLQTITQLNYFFVTSADEAPGEPS
ncbi:MAG: TolC family protein [Halieaceae bacterium]|jgi:outer membrane protein TolC|nr:TolC family protein [Halieaceae bacterium]